MSEKDILGGLVGEKEVMVGKFDPHVLYVFGIMML